MFIFSGVYRYLGRRKYKVLREKETGVTAGNRPANHNHDYKITCIIAKGEDNPGVRNQEPDPALQAMRIAVDVFAGSNALRNKLRVLSRKRMQGERKLVKK